MAGDGFIETGVDRLVKLVEAKKRISTTESAKILGVSPAVIDEWADFLEEEGIISIEYKLATTYLVERKLSKKEVVKKAKEFHGTKDAFIRKIETSVQTIDRDTSGLEDLKEQFKGLKDEIGDDLNHVKEELKELENYERLKKGIDKQMYQQQTEFRKKIEDMEKELFKERSRYKEMLDDIEVEKIQLEEEKSELIGLKDQESKLLEKLDSFKDIIKQIKSNIEDEEQKVGVTEDHVEYLERVADKVKKNITEQNEKIDPLIKEGKEQEENILKMQEDVLHKVVEGSKTIKSNVADSQKVAARFKNFFEKKTQVDSMLNNVDKQKNELKEELAQLIKKAHAFDLAAKSSNVKKYMVELNKKFKEIESKRSSFKREIDKLVSLIKRNF